MDRLAAVNTVAEDLVDRAFVDRLARPALAVLGRPRLRRVASAAEFLRQLGRRPDPQELIEDEPDEFRFSFSTSLIPLRARLADPSVLIISTVL